jgi:hypothetical protein
VISVRFVDQQRNERTVMPVAPSRKHSDQKSVTSTSSETTATTSLRTYCSTPIKSSHQHDSSLTQCLSSSYSDLDESLTSLCAAGASLDLNQHIPSRESREEKLLQILGPFCPDDEDENVSYNGGHESFGESFATDDFLHFSGGDRSSRLSFNKSGGLSFSDLHTIPENAPTSKDESSAE